MRASSKRVFGLGAAAAVAAALTIGSSPATAETSATPAPASAGTPTTAGSGSLSIAEMDQTGNHVMGAGIARNAGETEIVTSVPGAVTTQQGDLSATAQAASAGPPPGRIQGFDISAWQPSVNFLAAYRAGARFVYVKATEGTSYVSSTYKQQYATAKQRNLYRGGYVYAQPSQASGAATANYFFAHGGQWSADGKTLPPLLDIEYGSASQGTCYGKSWSQMRSWIKDFSNTVYQKTKRYPAIYTTTDWWKRCTNNSNQFSKNPLFVALYPVHDFTTPGTLGRSWSKWTFWQWSASGTLPGDQDVYRNSADYLERFASKTG